MKKRKILALLAYVLIGCFMVIHQGCSEDKENEIPNNDGVGCEGIDSIEYEGLWYHTVEIGGQCWMKENLNVGTMIIGDSNQTNNDSIEKYCYNNDPDTCIKYGGLYQWDEMMQYTTIEGTQGICPDEWHIPTDSDWKILEGNVDSQYGVGEEVWDECGYRGFDGGQNLKDAISWINNDNNTNPYEFSAIPGGFRNFNGLFMDKRSYARFWTSTGYSTGYSYYRYLYDANKGIYRNHYGNSNAFSIRCVKD